MEKKKWLKIGFNCVNSIRIWMKSGAVVKVGKAAVKEYCDLGRTSQTPFVVCLTIRKLRLLKRKYVDDLPYSLSVPWLPSVDPWDGVNNQTQSVSFDGFLHGNTLMHDQWFLKKKKKKDPHNKLKFVFKVKAKIAKRL